MIIFQAGGDGIRDGGTKSHMFAEDGDTSCLVRHPTWVFALSVHLARQLRTCWHTHLPFHS